MRETARADREGRSAEPFAGAESETCPTGGSRLPSGEPGEDDVALLTSALPEEPSEPPCPDDATSDSEASLEEIAPPPLP